MSYRVVRGDTLSQIAQRLLGDARRWRELKGYTGDPTKLPVGTILYTPSESVPPSHAPSAQAAGAAAPTLSWDQFPPEEKNMLMAMENQYEQANGFRIPVSDQQLMRMAQNGVTNMFDFAQQMWANVPSGLQENMPWAQFGLDHDTFTRTLQAYSDAYYQMTGQVAPQDLLASALKSSKGQYDVQGFTDSLKKEDKVQAAFPWIKYGLSYDQFTQFKVENKAAFGHALTDKEAAAALSDQHEHATRGSSSEAQVQGRAYQQQGKTTGDPQAATR